VGATHARLRRHMGRFVAPKPCPGWDSDASMLFAGIPCLETELLVPQVKVDPEKVHEFADAAAFEHWLSGHHDHEQEVWIKIHKVGSGLKTISPKEAIDVVLCWGWIDAIRKGLDETSFLQRYTRRGPKSLWSQINVDNVARLIAEGRMTEFGLRHVRAAQADGRWDRAYQSGTPSRRQGRCWQG
jgi:uncharacterized protein YdeI (YjbR/CyaY-like superfamily)